MKDELVEGKMTSQPRPADLPPSATVEEKGVTVLFAFKFSILLSLSLR